MEEHPATHPVPVEHRRHTIMAVFCYLWILILIPALTKAKEDPFVKYHLRQGLTLVIFIIIGWFVEAGIGWFPIFGSAIANVWWLASFILAVIGIVNALGGKEKQLPFIGKFAGEIGV